MTTFKARVSLTDGRLGRSLASPAVLGVWRMETEPNKYASGYDDEIPPAQTFTMTGAGSETTIKVNDAPADVG